MGSFSIWHWLVVLVVVLILFGGGGKLSRLMGDMARGVNAFKKGLKETDSNVETQAEPAQKSIENEPSEATERSSKDEVAKN